jgi:hypothetical protein
LNLVVNDAAKMNFATISFFGVVQELYNFFSGSTKRWDILKNHLINLTLKPLCTIRWESREALRSLKYQSAEIYDTLIEIYENNNNDNNSRHEAQILAQKIKNYKFICSIVIGYNVLSRVNVVSKMLQANKQDLKSALGNVIICIKELRTDEGFNATLESAKELAAELEIEPEFIPIFNVRCTQV